MVGEHFGVIDGAGRDGFHQHFGGVGVDQAGGDGEVFDPQFFQFEINRLPVNADYGDVAAGFDDILAHIPGGGDADRFDGAVHAVLSHYIKYLLGHVARCGADGVRCAELFGEFEAVFVHVAHDNRGGAVKLGGEEGGHAHGACAGDEYGVAGFHVAVLHADFMGGGQRVGEQQGDFFVDVGGQRHKAVVGIGGAHVFGLRAVDHVAEYPAAVAAVRVELDFAVVAGAAFADAGNNDFVAGFDVFHRRADFFDDADALVAEDAAVGHFGVFAFPDAQVGAANRGFDDFHHRVGGIDNLRLGFFFKADVARAVVNHCFHGVSFRSEGWRKRNDCINPLIGRLILFVKLFKVFNVLYYNKRPSENP